MTNSVFWVANSRKHSQNPPYAKIHRKKLMLKGNNFKPLHASPPHSHKHVPYVSVAV